MKYLLLLILFVPSLHSQEDKHSIYFENFEAIEFEVKNNLKILTFTVNRDKGLAKIIIIKHPENEGYLFSTIGDEGVSEPKNIDEGTVRWMMPTIIKNYTAVHKVEVEEINKIIDLIY